MIKKLAIALVVLALSHGIAFGYGIQWSSVNGSLNYADGVSTPLFGSTDSSLGCFVQLIWVGANGTIDQAYYGDSINGTGPTDDSVVDWAWVGAGGAGGEGGWFDGQQVVEGSDVQDGRTFYLRAWSAPASSFASGYVPTSSTNLYANSATWTWTKTLPTFDLMDFTADSENFNTTLSPMAIPEPAMFGLGIIGLISLRLFGRKRK